MGTIKFALRMLKADFKKSLFYCGSLIFSTMIVFVFFNMTANPVYGGDPSGKSQSFTTILSLIVVIIAMVMAFFANSFYLANKSKELAIETLSGGSVLTLANYILTQNFLIMLIAIPIGLVLGYLTIPLINSYLYPRLDATSSIWQIYPAGIGYTIVSLATEMVWLVIVDTGYAYRTEIISLIQAEKTMNPKSKGMIKLPDFVFVLLYVLPMILILTLEEEATMYLAISCIGLFGISGILKAVMPKMLRRVVQNKYYNHPHKIISINNLNHSLKQATTLIQMVIISATFLVCFMCVYFENPQQLVIILMSYAVLTFMMAVSITYKVMIEAMQRKLSFRHLKMIGYVTKDLKKVIAQEVFGLYAVIIIFPLLYFIAILFKFVVAGKITGIFGLGILLFYILIFVIAGFISYFIYQKIVLKGGQRS